MSHDKKLRKHFYERRWDAHRTVTHLIINFKTWVRQPVRILSGYDFLSLHIKLKTQYYSWNHLIFRSASSNLVFSSCFNQDNVQLREGEGVENVVLPHPRLCSYDFWRSTRLFHSNRPSDRCRAIKQFSFIQDKS